MKEKMILIVVAAAVGGIVGATVTLLIPGKKSEAATHFDELNVKTLKVSDTLFLWPEKKEDPDLIMTQGGILARTRIIATQICGNLLLGNAVFTTPDNPQQQVDQCRIFTEMGSNPKTGGAFVVRSPKGPNVLANGNIPGGYSYNVGFDENDTLWGYSQDNSTQERALMVLYKTGSPSQGVPQPGAPEGNSQTAPVKEGHATASAAIQNPYPAPQHQSQSPAMVAQPPVAPRN